LLMNVILSIKPKYVQSILSGVKRYEFRKSIFSEKYVKEAYIYVTAPTKRIVGQFEIGGIIRDSPECLWDRLGPLSGMNEAEFFGYFQETRIGSAIEIKHVEIFDPQYDPKELIPGFKPPQSFCYLKYSLITEYLETKGYGAGQLQDRPHEGAPRRCLGGQPSPARL